MKTHFSRYDPETVVSITGTPLDVYVDCPLASADQASWAVFRKRWESRTGVTLDLPDDDVPDPGATEPVSSAGLVSKPLLGYADRISVCNGQTIAFKVSAEGSGEYEARVVRLRCGDHGNVGFKQTAQCIFDGNGL